MSDPQAATAAKHTERLALLEEIADWAAKTRTAQKAYFRYRSQRDLHWSKSCEQVLDQKLARLAALEQPEQPRLF